MLPRTLVPVAAAVLTGVLYVLALPPFDRWYLGWICLVPLMLAVRARPLWRTAALGLLAGWTYAVLCGWWVWVGAHYQFGASKWVSTLFILLVVGPGCGFNVAIAPWLGEVGARRWSMPRALSWPCAWVIGEWCRSAGPLSMPWCLLGATQVSQPVLLQAADLGGATFISALVVAVNAALADAVAATGRVRARALALAAGVLLATTAYGAWWLAEAPPEGGVEDGGLPVAIVQGNIPQQERWQREGMLDYERRHAILSYRALHAGAEVAVWPETAAGVRRSDTPYFGDAFARIAGAERTLIVGLMEETGDPLASGARRHNVVLMARQGAPRRVYRKRRLVPFGEAVPFDLERFDFLGMRRRFPDPLAPGPEPPAMLEHAGAKIGALICYEFLFPDTLISTVRQGAEWLVVLSNDAWYDTTSAPLQHHAQVALAAVATRRPVVRATNTGISGGFDAWGRPLRFVTGELLAADDRTYEALPPGQTRLHLRRAGWGIVRVAPKSGLTPFARWGNWPPGLAVGFGVVWVVIGSAWRRSAERGPGGVP